MDSRERKLANNARIDRIEWRTGGKCTLHVGDFALETKIRSESIDEFAIMNGLVSTELKEGTKVDTHVYEPVNLQTELTQIFYNETEISSLLKGTRIRHFRIEQDEVYCSTPQAQNIWWGLTIPEQSLLKSLIEIADQDAWRFSCN